MGKLIVPKNFEMDRMNFNGTKELWSSTTMSEIQKLEQRIFKESKIIKNFKNWSFPLEYKEFLLKFNGGHPDPNSVINKCMGHSLTGQDTISVSVFFGIHDIKEVDHMSLWDRVFNYQIYDLRVLPPMLPIGDNLCGDLICIMCDDLYGLKKGEIYFWDHEIEIDEPDGFLNPDVAYGNCHLIRRNLNDLLRDFESFDD